MLLPRFQFTIRRFIVVVALCAVCLALLRSRVGFGILFGILCAGGLLLGFSAVAYAGVLPGFLIGRVRGGSGIIAGAISFSVTATLLLLVSGYPSGASASGATAVSAMLIGSSIVGAFAFIVGLLVSGSLYLIVEVTQILLHIEPFAATWGPRRLHPEPDWPVNLAPRRLYPEPDWPVNSDDHRGKET
jgi:hypothetical protein